MSPEQSAAFIAAQSACMLTEMEAMKAANQERALHGHSPAYGEDAFLALPVKYGVHHNAVVSFFQES